MILTACVSVYCLHAVPRGQRGWKIPLNWRNGQLWLQFGCWKTNLGSLEEQQCSPHPKTGSLCVALADLKLRDLAASVSWAPGLKACATLPSWQLNGWVQIFILMHSRGVPVSSRRKTGPESSCRAAKWHTRRYESTWKGFGGLVLAMSQVNVSMYPPTFFVLNTMLTNSMQFKKMTEPAHNHCL